jgi:hypothetical protein
VILFVSLSAILVQFALAATVWLHALDIAPAQTNVYEIFAISASCATIFMLPFTYWQFHSIRQIPVDDKRASQLKRMFLAMMYFQYFLIALMVFLLSVLMNVFEHLLVVSFGPFALWTLDPYFFEHPRYSIWRRRVVLGDLIGRK